MKKSALALSSTILSLTACGGGGGGSTTTTTAQTIAQSTPPIATTVPDCPTGFKSITLNNSSISNATLSLTAGKATFSFKTPTTAILAVKICFGVSATPIIDGGLYTLGDTYQIKAFPLDGNGNSIANLLERTLTIDFGLEKIPAGTNVIDIGAKTKVFNDSDGALAITPQASSSFSATAGRIIVTPSKDGRYVTAYKP